MVKIPTTETQLAVLVEKVQNIEKGVFSIQGRLEGDYVSNDRFEPVRNIVYGLVVIILTGVVGAVLELIFNVHK